VAAHDLRVACLPGFDERRVDAAFLKVTFT
jgi:hypothetical protein